VDRDLVDSRHVIQHSDPRLVARDTYTTEFMAEAESVAKQGVRHARFIVDMPGGADSVCPKPQYLWDTLPKKIPTALALVTWAKPNLERFGIYYFKLIVCGGSQVTVGPWHYTLNHMQSRYGIMCESVSDPSDDNIALVSLPANGHIRKACRSLSSCMQELVDKCSVWPIPSGSRVDIVGVGANEIGWLGFRSAGIHGWNDAIGIDFPLHNVRVTGDGLEAELERIMEMDMDEEYEDDDGDGGSADDDLGRGEVGDDDVLARVAARASTPCGGVGVGDVVDAVVDENPFGSLDDVVAIALDTVAGYVPEDTPGPEPNEPHEDVLGPRSDGDVDATGMEVGAEISTSTSAESGADAVGLANDRRDRGRNRDGIVPWVEVECGRCGMISGQYKKRRTGDSLQFYMYYYRVKNDNGIYRTQGGHHHSRQVSVDGGDARKTKVHVMGWIDRHRTCGRRPI
jgi:hypothetical protein